MIKHLVRNIYLFLRRIFLICVPGRGITISRIYPEKICEAAALRIDRIGDVVVCLPALKALKDIFPRCRLSLIVREQNIPLLKAIPWIDQLLPYRGFWKTIKLLRQRRFDILIDLLMDYPLKSAWLAYFSHSAVSAGFDLEGRGRLFTFALKPVIEKKLMSRYMLDLVSFLAGLSAPGKDKLKEGIPELRVLDADRAFAENFLGEKGIDKMGLIIALHPGGYFPAQRWPLERFALLADSLCKEYKAGIILLGSRDEERLLNKISSMMKTRPVTAIGLALDKLSAIIEQADIFVGNNSGLLHIAAALGRPTVSTMGPTVPWLWMPQGDNQIVLCHNLECGPCGRGICKEHGCMNRITVEEMERAVQDLLSKLGKV